MAGSRETVIFEAFPRMTLEEGSVALERLKGKEFGSDFVLISEIKSTSGDPLEVEMEVAAVVRKLMMDKAKQFAHGSKLWLFITKDGIDEIQKEKTSNVPVETGKAAAVIDEIRSEKMDKAVVEAEAGKAVAAIDKVQTEKMDKNQMERCAESDLPAGKHRLDGDYVSAILAMPRELPPRIPFSRGNNIAELLGVTEECLEKKRQRYREAAARSERISQEFAQFQEKVSEEYDRLGYVEVDDEYLDGVAELQEYSEELWKDQDRSGFKFYDPDRCQPEEGLCSLK